MSKWEWLITVSKIVRILQSTSCSLINATASTVIYTLSLHDALPIYLVALVPDGVDRRDHTVDRLLAHRSDAVDDAGDGRSEEHTSELQSRQYLVCRLLLEKKNIQRLPVGQLVDVTGNQEPSRDSSVT